MYCRIKEGFFVINRNCWGHPDWVEFEGELYLRLRNGTLVTEEEIEYISPIAYLEQLEDGYIFQIDVCDPPGWMS